MLGNVEFLTALGAGVPREERLILCCFRGDPATCGHAAWAPKPWTPGARTAPGPNTNNYVAVASFRASPTDGTFRRQTALFGRGLALMVDDVGTKVERAVVAHAEPTARIETSPGNEQWWYFLREPCEDRARFDAMIRAFIDRRLLGADPGMAGVNRVGRLPVGVNGKARHAGWRCRCVHWEPHRRWTIEELREAFGLPVIGAGRSAAERAPGLEWARARRAVEDGRLEQFAALKRFLAEAGMLKSERPRFGAWIDVRCPWMHLHTDRADSGAALGLPSEANDWWGAFQCHHGHCVHRRLRDVMEWMDDEIADRFDRFNARAANVADDDDQ